jgi:hypothetical protein
MPPGYLWDVIDYVPTVIDANLTGRGGWTWFSAAMGGDAESGLLAPYLSGDRVLVQTTNGHLYDVNMSTQAVTDVGAVPRATQNMIYFKDKSILFDSSQAVVPKLMSATSSAVTIGAMDASAPKSKVGVVYKNILCSGNQPNEAHVLRFGYPDDPTHAYDVNSFVPTSATVTGLAALRSAIIVFHPGSTERVRGSHPPVTGSPDGDLFLEPLFDRIGCTEPRTIAYWQDNVLWADEHGVHISDGATIRNVISQGGLLRFWRVLYGLRLSLAAAVFLDYYIISVRTSSPMTLEGQAFDEDVEPQAAGYSVTLICDLNKRQWFRWSNTPALDMFGSSGSQGMERCWAAISGSNRLASLGPCFFPNTQGSTVLTDADGTVILPSFDTPWYRLSNEGRKRMKWGYLSYDARQSALPAQSSVLDLSYILNPQDTSYTSLGSLPQTSRYTRYRLPMGQFPYGAAFRVRQTQGTSALRVYDLSLDVYAAERSRI